MFNAPFTQPQQFFAAWQSFMTGQTDRIDAITSQMEEAEAAAMDRANEAIDEYAKLMKASLRYNRELAAAWRSQFVDMSKTAVENAVETASQAAAPATSASKEA